MTNLPFLLYVLVAAQLSFSNTSMAHTVFDMQSDKQAGIKIAENKTNTQSVIISGMKDQDWKPYKDFLRGLIVFEEKHFLAPATDLSFVLRPQLSDIDLGKVRLRLEGDKTNKQINLMPNGVFKLSQDPAAAEDNAELTLNQKKQNFLWNIVAIRTPSLQAHQRRIGDLRLTCEVYIAIETWRKMRQVFNLAGIDQNEACASPRLTWTFYEPQAIKSATMRSGAYLVNLPLTSDGLGFTAPLSNPIWANDDLIELTFFPN